MRSLYGNLFAFLELFSELFLFFGQFFGDVDFGDDVHRPFGFEYSCFAKAFVSDLYQISELCAFGYLDFEASFWMRCGNFSS
jgi:hypothetical protein